MATCACPRASLVCAARARARRPDNVLLEWQLALALHAAGGKYQLACQEMLPLLVGKPFGEPTAAPDDAPGRYAPPLVYG